MKIFKLTGNLPGNLPGAASPVPEPELVRPLGQADHLVHEEAHLCLS